MRIANLQDRLVVVRGEPGDDLTLDLAYDVETTSWGRFAADPHAIYDQWQDFVEWAPTANWQDGSGFRHEDLGSPAPRPRQVFAIGLNYREHAAESGMAPPNDQPPVFTKFPTCITGPRGDIALPRGGHVDWDVELVAVIGRLAHRVPESRALDHVACFAVGQDISERTLQLAATPPQFSMGKSLPAFCPVGPWPVTLDELADPNDLALGCEINGESVRSDDRRGDLDAVVSYCSMVLDASRYPPEFPQLFKLAYVPESRQVVVEYQMPTVAVVPQSRPTST
jgi:2-keto-4-pentenoate hydratase/2-oxohepta-3-ene-1,7-dioic acid hydratase in catechol pathway